MLSTFAVLVGTSLVSRAQKPQTTPGKLCSLNINAYVKEVTASGEETMLDFNKHPELFANLWGLYDKTLALSFISDDIWNKIVLLEKNKKKNHKELKDMYKKADELEEKEDELLDKADLIIKSKTFSKVEQDIIIISFGISDLYLHDHCDNCNCEDK